MDDVLLRKTDLLWRIDAAVDRGQVELFRTRLMLGSVQTFSFQTIGMFRFGLPELVMFGISSNTALSQVVDYIIDQAEEGEVPAIEGTLPIDYFSRNAFGFEVQHQFAASYCDMIYSFYDLRGLEQPKIVQWVFADDDGRYPWHPAVDPAVKEIQVLLMHTPL